MRKLCAFVLLGIGLVAVGCKTTGPGSASQSVIVQKVEAAGSGDLDHLDEGAIQDWLSKHPDVVKSISPDCNTAMKAATADWRNTTEGHVCAATAKVLFFTPKDLYDGNYTHPAKK